MLLWLLSAISAYFLLAIASVGDRFLLVGPLPSPKVYAFFIALLGGVAIPFFMPFGFEVPDVLTIVLSLAAGFVWIVALVVAFEAITRSEVSRVVPALGAFVPIFTLLATAVIWRQTLSSQEIIAFLLLISGGFMITAKKMSFRYFLHDGVFIWMIMAAAAFAIGFLLMKAVFERETFINGFIWMRFGGLVAALALFLFYEVRHAVLAQKVALQKQVFVPFLLFQTAGGAGFTMQNFAIKLAGVTQLPLVNALEGTRYFFLFMFVWFLAKWKPQLLKEEMWGNILWQKIIVSMLIVLGVILLVL